MGGCKKFTRKCATGSSSSSGSTVRQEREVLIITYFPSSTSCASHVLIEFAVQCAVTSLWTEDEEEEAEEDAAGATLGSCRTEATSCWRESCDQVPSRCLHAQEEAHHRPPRLPHPQRRLSAKQIGIVLVGDTHSGSQTLHVIEWDRHRAAGVPCGLNAGAGGW